MDDKDKWEDQGVCSSPAESLGGGIMNIFTLGLGSSSTHRVKNTETGEIREISVSSSETVGEAIARGGDKFTK